MWWTSTTDVPYLDEGDAHADLEALCSNEHWEMLELWKKENHI